MNAVNLIPKDQRRHGAQAGRAGLPFLGLVLGLVVLLVASALYVSGHSRVTSREAQLSAARSDVARWSAAASSYSADVTLAKQRATTIEQVKTLAGQRADWSELLGQLAVEMPANSQLQTLSANTSGASTLTGSAGASSTTQGTSAAAASAPSSQIAITACAASQSVVAQTMVNLRRISGVSSVYLSSSTESGSGSTHGGTSGCAYPVTFSVSLAFTPPTTGGSSNASVSATSPTHDPSEASS